MKRVPSIRKYSGNQLLRIALPLGGIGTGTVSLNGRGNLRDWEIMNRPAKHYVPTSSEGISPFFAICARDESGKSVGRILESAIPECDYESCCGCWVQNHNFPHFSSSEFNTAYPFAQIDFKDDTFPVKASVQAFNPMIPGDSAASSLPLAVLRYVVRNNSSVKQSVSIAGTLPNFIGFNDSPETSNRTDWAGNINEWRDEKGLRGVFMRPNNECAKLDEAWGTIALSTPDDCCVSHRLSWMAGSGWNINKIDFWDDLLEDGMLNDCESVGLAKPTASLVLKREIPAGEEAAFTFYITWSFPNRLNWIPGVEDPARRVIQNHYSKRFPDAWEAARYVSAELPALEKRSIDFVESFINTDLPTPVVEAALFNVSTLRTQTCFQLEDGQFFGFEGCGDHWGSCYGSCTHVWNYEHATPFLFGDLARTMRTVEFAHATDSKGCMSFRTHLPLEYGTEFGTAAADGQMGCFLKLYREWQLCGDDEFLRTLWPHAKRALEFCWIENGWDGDRDGVMEGCQHNTMDVEYFGPNAQMTGWYLAALKAMEKMAAYLGEDNFAAECARLFGSGSRWMDENLFNGEYYIQKIVPPVGEVPACLYSHMGAKDFAKPDYQLGEACLIDQLVGQYTAHICGLGYLHDPQKIKASLRSIWKLNRKTGFNDHFNPMRSFAMGDESAILMASYPEGKRPKFPFPYYYEVMTGFEYTAAVGMIYEGMEEEGLQAIADIRNRYTGNQRNPFNEAECGHHYARAMASWAALLALTGFHYSAVTKELNLSDRLGRYFWSNGSSWGTYTCIKTAQGIEFKLSVNEGCFEFKRLVCGDTLAEGDWKIRAGESVILNPA